MKTDTAATTEAPHALASRLSDPQRGLGLLLVLASVLAFSTAGLFVKGVATAPWDIIFWRGVAAAGFTLLWIALRGRLAHDLAGMGLSGLAAACVGALGTAAFIASFKLTSITHVALIYALAPLLAALLAWLWHRERPSLVLLIACLLAFIGTIIMLSGGSGGQAGLAGDGLAFCMALAMAVLIVIYRASPKTPAAGPAALSSLLLLLPAAIWGSPFATAGRDIAVLAVFGLLFAIASITLAEGAKRLPSGQTALLSSLETPLAPLLAFLVLAEVPTQASLMGGGLILVAIAAACLRGPAARASPD